MFLTLLATVITSLIFTEILNNIVYFHRKFIPRKKNLDMSFEEKQIGFNLSFIFKTFLSNRKREHNISFRC